MFLVYVDESGDVGLNNSPSKYFCLSAIIVHEQDWHTTLEQIINFRRQLKIRYGFKLREEIHSSHFIHKPKKLQRIAKSLRLRLLRDVLDFQATLPNYEVINVVVRKTDKPENADIFELAWQTLLQRIDNTLSYSNFARSNPHNQENSILFVDKTDEVKLRNLHRKMRRYNPVPNQVGLGSGYRILPLKFIIEDAVHRDSAHSYFIQFADVNAYFLGQKFSPCSYVKKQGGRNYIERLKPILFTKASRTNPLGIAIR